MKLNAGKCQVITFHRCTSPLVFNYSVRGEELARVTEIRDLGVIWTSSLNLEPQVAAICRKANRMLGFIIRFSRNLTNLTAMKTLYNALVRQLLEYGSSVWSPHQRYLCDELEGVQRRFARMVGVKNGYQYRQVPIEAIYRDLGLQPLETRRHIADLAVLHKLLNGTLDCSDILQQIQFRTPLRTRSRELFVRQHHRTNYEMNGALVRMQRAGNCVPETVDFFQDSLSSMKRKLRSANLMNL
jgi:hypothetical protein